MTISKYLFNCFKSKYRIISPINFSRPMILFCKDYFKNKGVIGCEVGVDRGENSYNILRVLNIKKLYLVDLWTDNVDTGKGELKNREFLDVVKKRLKYFNAEKVYIKDYSCNAINKIVDKLDFVYIDANHNYQNVMNDIINYYPLVKNGGVIGGHDFAGDWLDVIDAVREFCYQNDLKFSYKLPDWWIVKEG